MLDADCDIDTRWKIQLLEFIYCASSWINDMKKSFVSSYFELIL